METTSQRRLVVFSRESRVKFISFVINIANKEENIVNKSGDVASSIRKLRLFLILRFEASIFRFTKNKTNKSLKSFKYEVKNV